MLFNNLAENEPGLCVCLQNLGSSYHPDESLMGSSGLDPFVRRQILRSSACKHNKANTTTFTGNGMTASNAASKLNTCGIPQTGSTTNRNNVDLQMEERSNTIEKDAGQAVIRNEIRHTSYRYININSKPETNVFILLSTYTNIVYR